MHLNHYYNKPETRMALNTRSINTGLANSWILLRYGSCMKVNWISLKHKLSTDRVQESQQSNKIKYLISGLYIVLKINNKFLEASWVSLGEHNFLCVFDTT